MTIGNSEKTYRLEQQLPGLDPGTWVARHGDALYRFALLRLRNPELAENAVQETFVAALAAQPSFSGRSSERTWLVGKVAEHRPMEQAMNAAEAVTCEVIEKTLGSHRAFRKVEDGMYVVKQGSSYVMINSVPWGEERAIVRCVAQLVKGVRMRPELQLRLLTLNASLRFGAFAYVEEGSLLVFLHSILGGKTLDGDELVATVRDVALIADDWDDRVIERYGGQRMQDLLEEQALARVLSGEFKLGLDA